MKNQTLKHLLTSFISKLICHKIIYKKSRTHLSEYTAKIDNETLENLQNWIPKKPPQKATKKTSIIKKETRRPPHLLSPPSTSPVDDVLSTAITKITPKVFTDKLPLDISMYFTSFLENKDRIALSKVNSNFYHFSSQKLAFYDFLFIPNGKLYDKLKKLENSDARHNMAQIEMESGGPKIAWGTLRFREVDGGGPLSLLYIQFMPYKVANHKKKPWCVIMVPTSANAKNPKIVGKSV